MANAKKMDYESTVTLPSRGILYKEKGIPAEISMRGMTTKEEKILYASTGGNVFQKILKNCIVAPEEIDVSQLIAADEMYLIVQLRIITYGPEYKVTATCPHCGRTETYTINLGDFDVDYLPENFEEPIKVTLPVSGDKLDLKILRNEDSEFIDRFAKKFAKQYNLPLREVEYVCRMARYITAINGEAVDFNDAREYVDNMRSKDSMKMWSDLNKIRVGIDTTTTVSCLGCGEEFDFPMPITSEFFRPTVE
jgi:hypothetical protein